MLAVPIQFDQHWVTIAWALEGAVLTLIGLKANDRTSRYSALVVFVIAVSHWATVDVHDFAYSAMSNFVPLLNRRALSGGVLVAALAAAAFFYKRYGEKVEAEERSNLAALYVLGSNMLALALLSPTRTTTSSRLAHGTRGWISATRHRAADRRSQSNPDCVVVDVRRGYVDRRDRASREAARVVAFCCSESRPSRFLFRT